MLKFFSKIRQKLLEEDNIVKYLKYAIGEIYILIMLKSPFRNFTWVEKTISQDTAVPLGTGYVGKPTLCKNHIAFLRDAISDYISIFYRYFVSTGHSESQGSLKELNLRFLC